ncbi:g2/mitotic-specific cyclin cdc13 [Mycena alexandri]|uniref:G2/mitotic-specific cyclin cdc13 n=1 Tax=Mycena alexandri TaxID=1745969 RepID=A0AAD6SXT1_9AGAR|nr:g2/mitotic-specific cyclin cdc13 [Mycena alexandri]
MASRIPIRRGRTAGAENDNVVNARPTHGPSRAKIPARAVPLAPRATTTKVAVASSKTKATEDDAPSSAKRKRQALQQVTDLNRGRDSKAETRKIIALPKKATTRPQDENARPQVSVPPPPPGGVRRLSSRASLIPVRQRMVDLDADDEEPVSKRQRTSSVGPEDAVGPADALGPEDVLGPKDAPALDAGADEDVDTDSEQWEDLDAADFDDPAMVSEYVADIQVYLKASELHTLPTADYMTAQTELTWGMRALLNDWLIQVHTRFRLLPETLFLAVNLTDRFLSRRLVSPDKLQLVGMSALLLASKFEETIAPAIINFVHISDNAYTEDEMRAAEKHMLRALEWDLSRYPSPVHFLRRASKADGYAPAPRALAKYLAEIVIVEHRLVATPPSLLAAASMWLARLALGEGRWGKMMAHYAMYEEEEVLETAGWMLRYVLKPVEHEAFYKKWAAKRNMKVSVYMRQWALARWDEGTRPNLVKDLPGLKREAREAQKTAIKALEEEKQLAAAEVEPGSEAEAEAEAEC